MNAETATDHDKVNGVRNGNEAVRLRSREFFRSFLKRPREVGSIIPSSPFLIRRIGECSDVESARVVVELGPGTGVLTREMLSRLPENGKLIAIEINEDFARILREEFDDPRLVVYHGCATEIESALAAAECEQGADLIVSGIPFSMLDKEISRATLGAARRALCKRGRFVAYQFRSHITRAAQPVFGAPKTHLGFWNIPPMKIYVWNADQA